MAAPGHRLGWILGPRRLGNSYFAEQEQAAAARDYRPHLPATGALGVRVGGVRVGRYPKRVSHLFGPRGRR